MARTRTRSLEPNNNQSSHDAAAVSDRRRRRQEPNDTAVEPVRKDRPTPSARQAQPRGTGSTGLINRIPVVRGIVGYFRGVASEMQKVTWPTREEATRLTYVVLGVTISFAIALGILDTFFSWWFRQAFHTDTEDIFLIVAAGVVVVVGGTYTLIRNRI